MYKNYARYLLFLVLFFVTLNVVFQIAVVDNAGFTIYDFAMNMLSELLGMLFAAVVFNELIIYRQRVKLMSKNKQLIAELGKFLKNLDATFGWAAKKCGLLTEQLWQESTFAALREQIDVSANDKGTVPSVPVYLYFSMQAEALLRDCKSIRAQYQEILEPEMCELLFYLTSESDMLVHLGDIQKIYESDLMTKNQRTPVLGSYFAAPTPADLQCINTLKSSLEKMKNQREEGIKIRKLYTKVFNIIYPVLFGGGAIGYFYFGHTYLGSVFAAGFVIWLSRLVYQRFQKPEKAQ